MVEKIGNVRNPLTVVAIFAGIAELSGSVVLPFISPCNQRLYIWFLMGFPVLLLLLFFGTLIFKHRVFYAPSDFRDDKAFLDLIKGLRPASTGAIQEKFEDEIAADSETEALPTATPTAVAPAQLVIQKGPADSPNWSTPSPPERVELSSLYKQAEDLVFKIFEKERGVIFNRNVESVFGGKGYTFDGVAISDEAVSVVEVKYFRRSVVQARLFQAVHRFWNYVERVPPVTRSKFRFTLAIVLDGNAISSGTLIAPELINFARTLPITLELRVFTMNELRALAVGL